MRLLVLALAAGLAQGKARHPDCHQPALLDSARRCRGYFPRFTWSRDQGCHPIVFGGCGAGPNLFLTVEECRARCEQDPRLRRGPASPVVFPTAALPPAQEEESDVCSLPPVWPGPFGCLAMMSKWTHSPAEGRCVPYSYGGCRGTPNLFDTEAACLARCPTISGPPSGLVGAQVCALPISKGRCRAAKPAFAFNAENNRCEPFLWGGCGGNGNRFPSLEQCVATCGGGEPQERLECEQVTCDRREEQLPRAKGCVPSTRPGECCPSSWDCTAWEARMANTTQCFYASTADPTGRLYTPGEDLPAITATNGCLQACTCILGGSGKAEIMCASVDCFSPRGGGNCRSIYDTTTQCCSSGQACGAELEALPTCELDGQTYRHGQKIYPAADPCLVCLCREGWTGDLATDCHRFDCSASMQMADNRLVDGCTPVHQAGVCCPTDWVCPAPAALPSLPEDPRGGKTATRASDSCLLPKDQGPCKRLMPSFYFNPAIGTCESFNYGGCRGNGNRFDSQAECQASCREHLLASPIVPRTSQPGLQDNCNAAVRTGNCRSRIQKYYYDQSSASCLPFFFSGCQGGTNMFDQLADCEAGCGPQSPAPRTTSERLNTADPCLLPLEAGPCRAARPAWAYSAEEGNCKAFLYGGCRGNANRFSSLSACRATCAVPANAQPARGSSMPMMGSMAGGFAAVPVDGDIKMVAARGQRHLVDNEGVTGPHACGEAVLLEVLRASQQVVAGTNFLLTLRLRIKTGPGCQEPEERTCLDVKLHRPLGCERSDYASCLELLNGGDILCERSDLVRVAPLAASVWTEPGSTAPAHGLVVAKAQRVAGAVQAAGDPCLEEKVVGRCRAIIPRAYYNSESKTCATFTYGGCGANGNNFKSVLDCQTTCARHLTAAPRGLNPVVGNPNPCTLPMDAGPCRALRPRHYFNAENGLCEQFIYGGCRGNANSFPSLEACQATCNSAEPAAALGEQRCSMGDQTFAPGDVLRLPGGPRTGCRSCVCSAGPGLTCRDMVCPLKMFTPPAGGVNCVMQRDQWGCCDAGYRCDSVRPPAPPALGGGLLGGYHREQLSSETKKLGVSVTRGLLTGLPGFHDGCDALTLLEVVEVHRQIVAGTNFKLKLRLRKCHGEVAVCEVRVHRPLPYACDSPDGCLQLHPFEHPAGFGPFVCTTPR